MKPSDSTAEVKQLLQLINSIRLEDLKALEFRSKNEDGEGPQQRGELVLDGRSELSLVKSTDEPVSYGITSKTIISVTGFEGDEDDRQQVYRFTATYDADFTIGDHTDKTLEELGITSGQLMPFLNSITWPLIRRHLLGSIENAGFHGVKMPFNPPDDLMQEATTALPIDD